jgi:hypothetical protein
LFVGRRSRLTGSDEVEAHLMTNLLVGSSRRRRDLIAGARVVAERILIGHDFEVRQLAAALVARCELTGAEVLAVIEDAKAILRSPNGARIARMAERQRTRSLANSLPWYPLHHWHTWWLARPSLVLA